MTDKEFDKLIRSKFNHIETPVSPNLWNKIAADPKKRRRLLPWWQTTAYLYPIAAVAILAVVVAVFWLNGNLTALPHKSDSTAQETHEQTNLPKPSNNSNTSTHPPVQNEVNNNHTPHLEDSSNTSLTIQNNLNNIHPNTSTTSNSQKGTPHKAIGTHRIPTNKHAELVELTNDQLVTQAGVAPAQRIQSPHPIEAIPETNDQWYALGKEKITSMYVQLPARKLPSLLNESNHSIRHPLACPENKHRNVFIDVFASPNIATQQVRSTGVSQAYLLLKDSTERMKMGFTIGGRITKSIGQNWFVSAGIQYTQNNQQFVQKTENERKTTVVLVTRSITNELGVTTTFLDTTTVTEIGYRTKTFINQYKSIEIPIIASYIIGNNDWQVGLHAGTVLGISNTYLGYTYDNNRNLMSLNNSNNPVYRSQLQVGLVGGFGIYKKLNYQTTVFAEPHFRYALTNHQSATLHFNQKIQLTGITAGIRLQLNNLSKSSISLQ